MALRRSAFLGATLALAFCLPAIAANWWDEIYCHANPPAPSHGGGGEPQSEVTSEGNQCHGKPGDSGGCGATEGDFTYGVYCAVVELPNGQLKQGCNAEISCPDGSGGMSLNKCCPGTCFGYEAFAGQTEIDGVPRFFIVCRKDDDEITHYCGDIA